MSSSRTVLFPIIAAAIIVAGGAIFIYTHNRSSRAELLQTYKMSYVAADSEGREQLTDDYLKTFTPAELLGSVEEGFSDRVCHLQAHPVGRSIYKKFPNVTESVRHCGGACTYGCFHGVLMELFQTDSDSFGGVIHDESKESYMERVKTLARDLCTKPEVLSTVRIRTCYHGLGHVFEYLRNEELDPGIRDCDIFSDEQAKTACISGVFMEHLFSASSSVDLLTPGGQPCDAYPQYEQQCHIYKAYGWLKVWGSVDAAMKACDSFGAQRRSCIVHTAQAAATPSLLETQEGFDGICGSFKGDDRDACFEGALVKIIDLNNGDDSEHACDRVTLTYYGMCLDVLKEFHKRAGS